MGLGVKTLVIIPTYNERESLPVQLASLRDAVPSAHVLVVDDGSPDGTGEWAQQQAKGDKVVHVMRRDAKQGLGAAYLAGFAWALERDYELIVEMDADGSHQARHLPDMLALAPQHSLVIGSRWVPGGSVVNWPRRRKFLSVWANRYVKLALGLRVQDATAGYRVYQSQILRRLPLSEVESQGYCFQIDMCWRVVTAGGTVAEVPIEFVERAQGVSKMSGSIVREALWKVTVWGIQRLFGRSPRPSVAS